MSLTRTVPASVPSDFHSSAPLAAVVALKYSLPLKAVSSFGSEVPVPALMSFTRTVPAAVPSVFHSSRPTTLSSAAK